MVSLEDFKEQAETNPEGFTFELKCLKCGSTNCDFNVETEMSSGSELTGCWNETTAIIKCLDCGNAYNYK